MYGTTIDLMRLRYPRPRPRLGRILRQVVVGLVAFGLLVFGLARVVQGSPTGAYQTVTVQPGDTLWAIAAAHYAGDPREGVWKLERRNRLGGTTLRPGQVLTRTTMLESVWGYDFDSVSNVLEVYMNFLRKKIDHGFPRKLLHTVRGAGYCIRADN